MHEWKNFKGGLKECKWMSEMERGREYRKWERKASEQQCTEHQES
jgi:hypothetical protein